MAKPFVIVSKRANSVIILLCLKDFSIIIVLAFVYLSLIVDSVF